MLENVRFYKEEEENDPDFAAKLARLGDVVVFDAFGQAHRKHASTVSLLQLLPSVAGLLLEKEIATLEKLIRNPKKPFVAILGGAKISDKIKVFENLLPRADIILVVGALANIFLKAKSKEVGASLVESTDVDRDGEKDWVSEAKRLLDENDAEEVRLSINWDLKKIQLPLDLLAASKISDTAGTQVINWEEGSINPDWLYLDIGPKTVKLFSDIIKKAGTIFWNGPAGYFELERFTQGTRALAKAVAESTATSIVGGGDTEKIVKKFSLEGEFTHVSTGGGASLKFLAGEKLPALEVLPDK